MRKSRNRVSGIMERARSKKEGTTLARVTSVAPQSKGTGCGSSRRMMIRPFYGHGLMRVFGFATRALQ